MGSEREETLCGALQERLLFWLWSSMAPKPDASRVAGMTLIESVTFETGDGKKLRGYCYRAHDPQDQRTEADGYILMAMGNAMVADGIVPHLKRFAEAGFDVYVYDYRGYANSEGNRRIKAMIEDYKEIAESLNLHYQRRMLYGTSLGGLVVLNAIGKGVDYDSAVIDSAPSIVSSYGCPPAIDPVQNLPADASRVLVITGERDRVLPPVMTTPLRIEAQKRGAKIYHGMFYDHPFMDHEPAVHHERMSRILRHFTGEEP